MSTTRMKEPATATSESKLLRTAGIGALIAGASYLLQPIIVFLIDPAASGVQDPEDPGAWYPDPADALATWYLGAEQSVQFSLVAVGMLMLVFAVGSLVRSRTTENSVWPQMSHALGVASGLGWLLVAGLAFGTHSSVAFALTDFTAAGVEAQKVGLQAVAIITVGTLGLVGLAAAGWILGLATTGRRAGVIGMPLTVISILSAGVLLANVFLNPLGIPAGQLALIVLLLILGVAFLIKARKSRAASS